MDQFVKQWFCWLEEGLEKMTEEEVGSFFKNCGQSCARGGVLDLYKKMYKQAEENLDVFFTKLNDIDGVEGEIVVPGKKYNLYFDTCFCDLHGGGFISSPCLCQCSKQSILYVMKELRPDNEWEVSVEESILKGDGRCKMQICLID